jgi:hypothetical protein
MKIQPELHKKAGVHYALTTEGLELPIVDVTHPAFAVSPTDAEQAALVAAFLAQETPFARLPPLIRRGLLRFFLRGSVLARGIRGAQGTFLGGMNTYLLKLGPGNLGDAYAKPIDRRIAASLPVLAVRWRVADMARLLADRIAPLLEARPGSPLRFVNIAGGPAMDSLNALLLLARDRPALLAGRAVAIDVLDRDSDGPTFGARALVALSAPGAPLHAVDARLHQVRYDWNDPGRLRSALDDARAARAIAVGSSEGGLFEYGTDDAILANLAAAREAAPPDFAMLGSVTRADRPVQRLRETSQPATRPRGLEMFRALVARAGWRIERAIERPFSDQVVMAPSRTDERDHPA